MLKLDVLAAELNLWANETEQIYRATKESKYRGDAKHLRYLAATLNQSSLPSTGVTSFNTRVGDVVLSSLDVTTALGYNPVTQARTLTINGVTYDLSANRSWTISTATPTLAEVTTAGNTTTNAITVGKTTVIHTPNNGDYIFRAESNQSRLELIHPGSGGATLQMTSTLNSGYTKEFIMTGKFKISTEYFGNAVYFGNSSTTYTIFTNTNNFAIGTTTDAGYKLDVNGTARVQGAVVFSNSSISNLISLQSSTSTSFIWQGNNTSLPYQQNNLNIQPYTGSLGVHISNSDGTTILYAKASSTGDSAVGIGTSSPLFKVDISNRVMLGQYPASSTYGAVYLGNITPSSTNYSLTSNSLDTYLNGTNVVNFSINDVIKARIASTGNVLIGTITDAGYKLQVQGPGYFNTNTASTNSVLRLTDANTGTAWAGFSSSTTTGFFIGSNGGITLGQVTADNSNPSTAHARISINSLGNPGLQLSTNSANVGIVFSDGVNGTIRMNFPSAGEAAITTISAHNLSIGVASSVGSLSSTTMKFFQSTGNVAINSTTDAGYKLDVNGTARVQTNLNVGDTAFTATTPNYISLGGTYATSGYGAKLKLLDSGATQWGIGVSTAGINYYGTTHNFFADSTTSAIILSPSADTASTSPAYIAIGQSYSSVAGANPKLRLFGTTYGFGVSAGQVDYIAPTHVFYANGSEAMRITSTGNVGIGISNPTEKLHIADSNAGNKFARISAFNSSASGAWVVQNDQIDNIVYRIFGSTVGGTQFGQSLNRSASLMANLGGSGKFLIGSYSGTDLIFGTSDQARMRLVDSTGNFLIGTMTDSGHRLNVSGTANVSGNLTVGGIVDTAATYTNCALLSSINVGTNSTAIISFTAKQDPNGWWNAGTKKWIPTIAGYYYVALQVRWDIGTLGNQINIQILKNTSTQAIAQDLLPTNTGLTQTTNCIVYMNGSTDYLEFSGFTSSTTGEFLFGEPSGTWTFFNAFRIN